MLNLQFRDQPGRFVELSSATITLGRDQGNDVVVDAPSVSDFHAKIVTARQGPQLVDLHSAHGTFVNERRISERCSLQVSDVIRLGTVEFELSDPGTHPSQDWGLRADAERCTGQIHRLGSRTIVGREPGCDLLIDRDTCSRRHAELLIEGDHLRVTDLGSANGTFLNGEKIEQANARPGDVLRFDKQQFIVVGPAPAQVPHDSRAADLTVLRAATGAQTIFEEGPRESAAAPLPARALNTDTNPPLADAETLWLVRPPPPAELTEITAAGEPRVFVLACDRQRLGRGEECAIVLAEKSVSKLHAEFAYERGAWLVRDLGSSNGVLVNGQRIQERELVTGDRVQLGRLEFAFRCQAAGDDGEDATMLFRPAPAAARGTGGVRGWRAGPDGVRRRVWFALLCLLGLLATCLLIGQVLSSGWI